MKASVDPPRAAHPPQQRYWPGRMLAVGGMAEIHLARQGTASGDGFHKELVIKRLKPELAADPRAVAMFLEEARIGALLNHPNVVQVYDAGQDGAAPFIAMEYIRGEELNQLCRRGLAVSQFLPLEHAVELVRQSAMALGYVHALRDDGGRGLEIVHCDVSPTNLLVTEDGHIKLIDFGIARARGQSWRDEQALPGKLSYMSPEQARRRRLDHRSDIFSLGVVLYEITLGQRLFRGPAHEVLRRLERCEVRPPTFVRRDFPGMLESIVMRALERDPGDRYASAYDMADELDEFLRESARRSGPLRLARYLDELAVAVGGSPRSELVAERARTGDEEALDFDRGMFDGYVAGTQSAPVAEWDEWVEESGAVASALSAEVDAAVSRQTENRRQATGNRKPETSESLSGPRAADSGSEDAGSLSLLPVACHLLLFPTSRARTRRGGRARTASQPDPSSAARPRSARLVPRRPGGRRDRAAPATLNPGVMSRGRIALLLVALAACRDQSEPARGADEESLGQRVFQAPAGVVRAVPPHRIQPNGIGPYLLGAEFKAILSTLPHGPRVEVLQIDRVVGYRLVRVAQDAILVGIGQGGKASMVAALDPEIAKTEDGWGVGSEIDTLREALGPERAIAGARDPKLVELARLPGARVVVRGHRVAAIVVGPDGDDDRRDVGPADALSGGATSRPAAGASRPRPPAPPAETGCTVAKRARGAGRRAGGRDRASGGLEEGRRVLRLLHRPGPGGGGRGRRTARPCHRRARKAAQGRDHVGAGARLRRRERRRRRRSPRSRSPCPRAAAARRSACASRSCAPTAAAWPPRPTRRSTA